MAGKILLLKFATYPLAEVQISGVQNYYIFISEDWSAEEDSKNWVSKCGEVGKATRLQSL